jgi:molybdenum cofactor biosynthesis enzyme MoaA
MHCTISLKPCSHWRYNANDGTTITGDWEADYAQYIDTINRLKTALPSGEACGCDGCAEAQYGLWQRAFAPRLFALHDSIKGERCNCRCVYCDLTKSGGNTRDGAFTAVELLNGLGAFFPPKTMFYYAPAELTVSPYKREIYDYIRKHDWEFSVLKTSGILYDEEIAAFMQGGGRINCSLDSGTRESYARVKGVDCFDGVVANMKRYRAAGAKIELKYILLEKLNDGREDADGFVRIAAETADQIILTVDMNTLKTGISGSMWAGLEYLAAKAKETGLPIRLHSEHLRNEDYERLSKLLC